MRRRSELPLGILILCVCLTGCGEEEAGIPHTHDPALEVTLCGRCGEVKGSAPCCQEADNCEKCGLHEGSVLCCSSAIHGVRDVILCRKCGEERFTEACCRSDDAEACEKCGLFKGSPGCCKISDIPLETVSATSHAHEGHAGHE